ncbi:MAG TPA: aminotransferase class III-fold pyridoxal phosphate-dependent enzyme, partial [Streptomyces sp.]|nr:aminotransferase class III-fold pyridoxal phosphate-dependent enzyme [Streptomyces sp.]
GVEPDLVTLAKGLGGGLPIGATVAFGPAADLLEPGQHGTTFGGNPVACAAGLAVLDTIAADGLLDQVKRIGEKLRDGIESLRHPLVSHVRGAGLLLGIVLTEPLAAQVQRAAQDAGLLVNAPAPDVVRLMPALVIDDDEVESFLRVLPGVLDTAHGDR